MVVEEACKRGIAIIMFLDYFDSDSVNSVNQTFGVRKNPKIQWITIFES